MTKKRKIGSVVAVMLSGAILFTACGKISLATLLVLDPAATNTLKITLPEDAGGRTVTSHLVGNIHTTVTVDSNKIMNVGGAPGTVKVNSFDVAGTPVNIGVVPTGTLCTYIPEGAQAGGTCNLNPLWTSKATFNLSIPTETVGLNPTVRDLIPPIPLTLQISNTATMNLNDLIELMQSGTGLTMHVVLDLTIPADIPIVGGSPVVMDTTLTSTKTAVTDPKLDECVARCTCGNGVVEAACGETCDTAITSGEGVCPTSCDDGNACTIDTLTGSNCTAACAHTAITACANGDGCCPIGCDCNTDNDCLDRCGNGFVCPGETCDGNCPTSCDDGNKCTTDAMMGSAATCNVVCTHTATLPCGDFCGWSTNAYCSSDSDCMTGGCSGQVCQSTSESIVTTCEFKECYRSQPYGMGCGCVNNMCQWSCLCNKPVCGNGIVEPPEECDPPSGISTCFDDCLKGAPCERAGGQCVTDLGNGCGDLPPPYDSVGLACVREGVYTFAPVICCFY